MLALGTLDLGIEDSTRQWAGDGATQRGVRFADDDLALALPVLRSTPAQQPKEQSGRVTQGNCSST